METPRTKLEEFKLSLVKDVEAGIKAGLDAEDIIGTLENVKMMTFRLCRVDIPEIRDHTVGYR